ncbi:Protein sidekick-2, partial [Exaiptasia diaphana]
APGQPETIEAITMNTTCIKLQFKKPKEPVGGKIRTFVISYRPVDSPSQEPIVINITTTVKDSYDHDICGLSAGTVYTFNVSFTTIATGPSVNIEGKTQGPVPTGAPKVVSHNGTLPYDSSTTCKITWDMLSAAESQGNLTSFRITYNKLDSSEIMYCEIGICNTTKILTELDHNSIYSVTVSATNSQGIGPSSKPVLCYTESLAPAGPPQNLSAICKTSTSIVVKWAAVDKRLRNGAILGHNITYLKHGDPPSNSKHITVYGESTLQAEITQLEKYTEYNLSINAFTSKGAGNYSTYANISAFTCEDVPDGPPSDLKVLEQSNISCTISWSAINATMANGIIKGYEVTGNDTNNTDSNTNCVGTILTCGLNATFKELKPFRMHHFKASGFNSKGSSIYSEILECMTQEGAPLVAPPNLRCTPKTSRSMEVCWDDMPMLQKQGRRGGKIDPF